jgi:hypothetical protein
MNKSSIKLKDGNHAIVQSCSMNNVFDINARIGIVLPRAKCVEYINIENWNATYKGSNNHIKNQLLYVYDQNIKAIRKNVMAFIG